MSTGCYLHLPNLLLISPPHNLLWVSFAASPQESLDPTGERWGEGLHVFYLDGRALCPGWLPKTATLRVGKLVSRNDTPPPPPCKQCLAPDRVKGTKAAIPVLSVEEGKSGQLLELSFSVPTLPEVLDWKPWPPELTAPSP